MLRLLLFHSLELENTNTHSAQAQGHRMNHGQVVAVHSTRWR